MILKLNNTFTLIFVNENKNQKGLTKMKWELNVAEVKKVKKYNVGYEIRDEVIDGSPFGIKNFNIRRVYDTATGLLVGDLKLARILYSRLHIKPYRMTKEQKVARIGRSRKGTYVWNNQEIRLFKAGDIIMAEDASLYSFLELYYAKNSKNVEKLENNSFKIKNKDQAEQIATLYLTGIKLNGECFDFPTPYLSADTCDTTTGKLVDAAV